MSAESIDDVILRRRSTRHGYRPDPIPRQVVERIVRCGLAAPSSKASVPWHLTVVQDRTQLERVSALMIAVSGLEDFRPHDPSTGLPIPHWASTVIESAEVLTQVGTAIFLQNAGPFSRGRKALLEAEPPARALALFGYELELAGLGAALQNMWLAAEANGVSAVFMGDVCVAEPEIKKLLGVDHDLLGVLALGYANKDAPTPVPQHTDSPHVTWL